MYGLYGYYDEKKKMWVYFGQDKHLEKDERHKDHNKISKRKKQIIDKVLQNDKKNRYIYMRLFFVKSLKEANYWEQVLISYFKTYKYDYPERSVFNFEKGGKNAGTPSGKNSPFYKHEMRIIKGGKTNQNKQTYAIVYDSKKVCRNINKTFLESLVEKFNKNEISIEEIKILNKEENKKALSLQRNKSGYKNVGIYKNNWYKSGKAYRFSYYEDGEQKSIEMASLEKLEIAMNKKGFKLERL
jgi:hypothetical protein